jgi:hypothetical protein
MCGVLPPVGLLPDAGRLLDGPGVRLTRDKALVHTKAQEQFDHLKAFEQLGQVRRLVDCHVRAKHQNHDLDAFRADLLADGAFEVARHVLDHVGDAIEQRIGRSINRKLGVQGHDGLNDQITEGINLRTARARNS